MPSPQPILIQKFTGFTLTCRSATRALSSTDLDCVALLICPTNHHHHLPQLGQCCTLIYTTHTYALHLNIQIHKNHSHIHAGIYQKNFNCIALPYVMQTSTLNPLTMYKSIQAGGYDVCIVYICCGSIYMLGPPPTCEQTTAHMTAVVKLLPLTISDCV